MINKKCPKCGSTKVELSNERSRHGILMTIIFGIIYLPIVFCRWSIAFMILLCYDWWMYIIKKTQNKGYIWLSKRFVGSKKIYYCHNCGFNFRA